MKKNISYINKNYKVLLIAASIFILGCSEDFLERDPLNSVTPSGFYNTDSDLIAATNSIYAMLANMPWEGFTLAKPAIMESDNMYHSWRKDMHFGTQTPNSAAVDNIWLFNYTGIQRSNEVIKHAGEAEVSGDVTSYVKEISLGQAHCLRAYFYFDAVRLFGDIPILTEPTLKIENAYPARSPKEEVFQLIIEDLELAIQKLPGKEEDGYEKGRVSKQTAQVLLAQVNLWLAVVNNEPEKLDNAISLCTEVIDYANSSGGKLMLLDNYADIFKEEPKNNAESLFEVQYKNGVYNNWYDLFFAPRAAGSWGTGYPISSFTMDYAGGKNRRDASIITLGETFTIRNGTEITYSDSSRIPLNGGYDNLKYVSGTKDGFAANGIDVHILRLAHAYYIKAEALARKNGGPTEESLSLLNNKIRVRAGLEPIPTGLSLQEFIDVLIEDRRYEFYFENERRYQLIRTGKFISTMNAVMEKEGSPNRFSERDLLLPIPQGEMNLNPNLTQNPGY